jgi:ankyrin repeat protein
MSLPNIHRRLRTMFAALCLAAPFWAGSMAHAQATPSGWWVDIENDRADKIRGELAQGANPNIKSPDGRLSLQNAVTSNSWNTFDVLLADPRTDVNAENAIGETPLMYVAIVGDMTRAQALLARGAQVNKLGWTPLHYAASKGQTDMAKLLLKNDAMPNAPAPGGINPLMMAAYANSRSTVQLLLSAGADPLARDENGQDAANWAEKGQAFSLAKELQELVAQRLQARKQSGQDAPTQTLPPTAPAPAPREVQAPKQPEQPQSAQPAGQDENYVQGVSGVRLNKY